MDFFGKKPKFPLEGQTPADGLPGARRLRKMPQDMETMILTRPKEQKVITHEDVKKAAGILAKYKEGKANLEDRIVKNEQWWKLRHWEVMRPAHKNESDIEPSSAWIFNAIMNKHADAMDNFPEPVVLPRESADESSAKVLTSVLPVVLENCGYHDVYSDAWWEKLKHGTAVYGVFWDAHAENGLGDVTVTNLDLLNIFWEPGISKIQKSRNLFITELVDNDILEEQYPECKGKLKGDVIDVKKYIHDENIDTSHKSVVVDWYYRVAAPGGRELLHFAKFVGDTLLYASQNDEKYRDTGWYEDGKYPVEFDVLFPEKDMPTGFGIIDICRDPQEYIDRLFANILESSMMGTKKRFFASRSTNINIEQFKNWNEPIVDVEGEIDETRIREIVCQPFSNIYLSVAQMKIDEMKDTAANRDVNNGGGASGATAAAAIAALQEAGNKNSRDMIDATYRVQENIYKLVIERMRQYYEYSRTFRIIGNTAAGYEFKDFDASAIRDQVTGVDSEGNPTYRHPVFDLKIKAQKKNPFSRMEQNERAKELYALGFFNPERAEEAVIALDMMEFEGKEKVLEKIQQGQTLLNICQKMQAELSRYQAMFAALTGNNPPISGETPENGGQPGNMAAPAVEEEKNHLASGIMEAHTPMTDYGQQLAKRSSPSME